MTTEVPFDPSYWQFGVPPVQHIPEFIGQSGPRHTLPPDTAIPWDYFCLFIPIYWWTKIALFTNTKANMESDKKDGHVRDFYPTCAGEIKAFIASVMLFCLCKSQSMEQFYNKLVDPAFVHKWFSSMSRWQQLKRFLKVSDPHQDTLHPTDRMYRVRELFECFISRCRSNYWPTVCIAVDECIKKFKGRCVFKQYIKNKPVRWGIKIFAVCCSATSYMWNAAFYLGKRSEEKEVDKSITQKTVLKLLEPLSGFHHKAYFDNYYTSIPLLVALQKMCIYCTGTIRVNRKGLDKRITIKKAEETSLKKTPGYCRYSSYGSWVFAAWFDKRPVHLLSNCHIAHGTIEEYSVQHWYPSKEGKVLKTVFMPSIVLCYNQFMGAVDRFDQYRSYIKLEMRSSKFWHPMMWFIFESALVNAWVLYKSTRELAALPLEYDHFTFRRSIIMSMASEWESMGCTNKPSLLSPTTAIKQVSKGKRAKIATCLKFESKFATYDDHADYLTKIPPRDDSLLELRQLQCKYCLDGRTVHWCRLCAVPLHKGNCFAMFHRQKPSQVPK